MTELTIEQEKERAKLALKATYKIEALSVFLKKELPTEVEHVALRCLVNRIHSLNSAIMSILGGEDDMPTVDLQAVVQD